MAAFSRTKIFARRGRLFAALAPYLDREVSGAALYAIVDALLADLPSTVSRNAVFESVRALTGTILSRKVAGTLAWRLAGNMDRLIAGEPVLPWTRQLFDEQVPICVERIVPTKKRDQFGYVFHCRALAGTSCTELLSQFFSNNSCRAVARAVGFSTNSWGPLQYGGVGLHFVNLLFFAHVEAARSRERPAFHRVSASSSMLKYNKDILLVRCRAEPCPLGFEHPCMGCFKGYDECSFATHAKTYTEAECRVCGTVSFFDPEQEGVMCVNCRRANHHVSQ